MSLRELDDMNRHDASVACAIVMAQALDGDFHLDPFREQVCPYGNGRFIDEDSVIDDPSGR